MGFDEVLELKRSGNEESAVRLALQLAAADTEDFALQYKVACLLDSVGREPEAVAFYVKALVGLTHPRDRAGALLGLGSTYRTLGQYSLSIETFDRGVAEFPTDNAIKVFRAMTLYNLERSKDAMAQLLSVIADTANDERLRAYDRAIRFYAEDLDKIWVS